MIDVRRLRVLREVANTGSFSAAGESLGYTQSAVSQQIAALERETGSVLVERNARGVRLTDSGRTLVEHADGILARLAAAEDELDAIAGLRGGRLRLASFPTAGATLVPLAIAEFIRRHPEVELSLVEAEPEEAVPMLKAGDLDLALLFEYSVLTAARDGLDTRDIDQVHLLDDPMYLALPPDHPCARRRRVRLEDLAEEAWVQGDCNGLCGQMHIAACQSVGFTPRVGFQTNDYNVVQGLVAAGVAVSLIAELALANLRDDVVVRSLGKQAPVRHVTAATLAGGYRSPAVEAMLEVLQDAAREYSERRRSRLQAA
jgi:DNA-binding transcriptional LysR family regulator